MRKTLVKIITLCSLALAAIGIAGNKVADKIYNNPPTAKESMLMTKIENAKSRAEESKNRTISPRALHEFYNVDDLNFTDIPLASPSEREKLWNEINRLMDGMSIEHVKLFESEENSSYLGSVYEDVPIAEPGMSEKEAKYRSNKINDLSKKLNVENFLSGNHYYYWLNLGKKIRIALYDVVVKNDKSTGENLPFGIDEDFKEITNNPYFKKWVAQKFPKIKEGHERADLVYQEGRKQADHMQAREDIARSASELLEYYQQN